MNIAPIFSEDCMISFERLIILPPKVLIDSQNYFWIIVLEFDERRVA